MAPWEAYGSAYRLPSREHVLLAEAVSMAADAQFGIDGEHVRRAYTTCEPDWLDLVDREEVASTIASLHELILQDRIHVYTRPFGGGWLRRSPVAAWEIDDPLPRFSWSAMDPDHPFDADAVPTHWLVVPRKMAETLAVGGSEGFQTRRDPDRPRSDVNAEHVPASSRRTGPDTGDVDRTATEVVARANDVGALLRRTEVLRLTGFEKTTLYDKIAKGTFPAQIALGSRMSRWRESDIAAWLRDPR